MPAIVDGLRALGAPDRGRRRRHRHRRAGSASAALRSTASATIGSPSRSRSPASSPTGAPPSATRTVSRSPTHVLRRPRKDPVMSKRVVLIGHPVAHSLSAAMQQAAFDSPGIDAKYELWDRAPDGPGRRDRRGARRRLPRRERHDPAQGAGRPDHRPADRGGAGDRRGQHAHPRGPPAGRAQHRRARLQLPRSTSSSGARRCRARPSCSARAAAHGPSSTG